MIRVFFVVDLNLLNLQFIKIRLEMTIINKFKKDHQQDNQTHSSDLNVHSPPRLISLSQNNL